MKMILCMVGLLIGISIPIAIMIKRKYFPKEFSITFILRSHDASAYDEEHSDNNSNKRGGGTNENDAQ